MAGRPGRTRRKLQAQIELGVGESNPLFRERVFGEMMPTPRVITPPTERGIAVTKKQIMAKQPNPLVYRARSNQSFGSDVQGIFDRHHASMKQNAIEASKRNGRGSGGSGGSGGRGGRGGRGGGMMMDEDEQPLFEKIDTSNTAYKLRALGFEISQALKQHTFDNKDNRNLIVNLLKELNAQDAEDFDAGRISFLDLMYHPLSPYKIWAYGD